MIRGGFGEDRGVISTKVKNTMRTIFKRSLYKGYDVMSDAHIALGSDAILAACEDMLLDGCAISRIAESQLGPSVLRPLEPLSSPHIFVSQAKNTLKEIAIKDAPKLVQLSFFQAKNPEIMGQVAVRTVFGASEEMPVRSLSYLLPALHLAEALRRSERFPILPQIQFILMSEMGTQINHLNGVKVAAQTELFMRIAKNFIREFYPELLPQVVFLTDNGFLGSEKVQELIDIFTNRVDISRHMLYSTLTQELSKTKRDNSLLYASLHVIVHDMSFGEEVFVSREGKQIVPRAIINIGGQNEKLFYKARRMFLESMTSSIPPVISSIQLFTCHKVPPYMKMENDGFHADDVSLSQAITQPSKCEFILFHMDGKDNLLHRDLRLLEQDISHSFIDFLSRQTIN